jgi:hypothetical protein
VEADPGLVGQGGNPPGRQHRWEGPEHAWQPPGRHHRHTVHDDLAPGDLGAMDSHNWHHHHHVGVGQDLAAWSASQSTARRVGDGRIAAMPQPPRPIELQPAPTVSSKHGVAARTDASPGVSSACFPDRRLRIQTHLIQMNPAG